RANGSRFHATAPGVGWMIGQRLDVGGEFPDLLHWQKRAERGHAVGTSLDDRRGDILDASAVDKGLAHQRRPEPASAIGMTAGAIHRLEELLPRLDMFRAFGIFLADFA